MGNAGGLSAGGTVLPTGRQCLKRVIGVLAGILLLWGANTLSLQAQEAPATVLVTPFTIHSEEPLGYLSQSLTKMLSSRLDAHEELATLDEGNIADAIKNVGVDRIDEEAARKIGVAAHADSVVVGSLTKIGESISLDVKIIDIGAGKPTVYVSHQDTSLKALISAVNILAEKTANQILGKVIVTGIVVTGNRLIENDAILYHLKMKVGDVFSMKLLQDEIQNIYTMGYFNDIQVDSVDEPLGKKITFIVKENPEIAEIRIAGNKDVKTSEIQDEIDIKLYRILDFNEVKNNVIKIRDFYRGRGYYNALVDYSVDELSPDTAAVVFQIVEHHSMKIKKIEFVGTEKLKAKKIKKIMETREKNLLSFITDAGIFKEEALQQDLDRIKAFYYDYGYMEIKVGEADVTHDEKWIYITIPVEEGEQYRVSGVSVAGDLIEPEEDLMKYVKVSAEEVFSRSKIHDDIMALTDVYGGYGYAFVDITPLTDLNADEKAVHLTYDIAQGEKVRFEKIAISGNDRTRDKVIRREMRFKEGDLYNNQKLKKSRERINNLGYFEDVTLNTRKGSSSDTMIVDVNVKEKPTGMISAGAGYSSVDDVVGMFQISQNNFFGTGRKATLMAQLGGNSRYKIALTDPYIFDKEIAAGFDLYRTEVEYDDFDSESSGIELSLGIIPFGWEDYSLGFSYNYASVDISNVYADADWEIRASEGTTKTSSLTTIFGRDTVDDRFYPMRGSVNSISLEFAGGPFGASEDFIKTILDSRWYFPFKWATAFMARGSFGYVREYGGGDVAVFERFFLGGLDSLRGFKYRHVGPRGEDNPNDVVGGNKMLIFNFEYLFPLIKAAKIRGLVFFDAGNAWSRDDTIDFDLRESVGFGVRWNSPFGPLRIEWGYVLDKKDDEDGSQLEFSMGTVF